MQYLWYVHKKINVGVETIVDWYSEPNRPHICNTCNDMFYHPIRNNIEDDLDPFLYLNLLKKKDVSYIFTSSGRMEIGSVPSPMGYGDKYENTFDVYGIIYKEKTYCIHCYKRDKYDFPNTKENKKEK
jgi:hypothetical protein